MTLYNLHGNFHVCIAIKEELQQTNRENSNTLNVGLNDFKAISVFVCGPHTWPCACALREQFHFIFHVILALDPRNGTLATRSITQLARRAKTFPTFLSAHIDRMTHRSISEYVLNWLSSVCVCVCVISQFLSS